jgi:rhodanese-related sulfurtransferase
MSIKPAKELVAEANNVVRVLSADEARALHGKAVFIDVREPAEWEKGRVPGAVHVPRGLLEFAADPAVPTHKPEFHQGKPLILYCGSGGRSALAARTLKEMGFADVAHVAGGFGAWKDGGGEVET